MQRDLFQKIDKYSSDPLYAVYEAIDSTNLEIAKVVSSIDDIELIKGEPGEMGPTGPAGESIVGPKGDKGDPGRDGKDGKDAQPIDETAFAAKLKAEVKLPFLDGESFISWYAKLPKKNKLKSTDIADFVIRGGGVSTFAQLTDVGPYSASAGLTLVVNGTGTGITYAASGTSTLVIQNISSAYTALITDDVINCDTSGGSFTVTLPAAATMTKQIRIKLTQSSANTVTLQPNGAETIDGAASYLLTNPLLKTAVVVISDGTNLLVY